MKTILVVEDEMQIARIVRDYLEVAGFDVIVVGDGEAALASARGDAPRPRRARPRAPGHRRPRRGARAPRHVARRRS